MLKSHKISLCFVIPGLKISLFKICKAIVGKYISVVQKNILFVMKTNSHSLIYLNLSNKKREGRNQNYTKGWVENTKNFTGSPFFQPHIKPAANEYLENWYSHLT